MADLPGKEPALPDPWIGLRRHTDARIALGRAGVSIPSAALLDFKLAHAHARDAVYATIDYDKLVPALELFNHPVYCLQSRVSSKQEYLQRPDLGRRLSDQSREFLQTEVPAKATHVSISIADGLSALAINDHAVSVIELLLPLLRDAGITLSPMAVIGNGRVAISDEVGSLMHAEIAVILIGERPGLSSPNSLGVYITYGPGIGRTDEARNCISNIRPEGLSYADAADRIFYLIREALRRKLSGVALKDNGRLLN